MPRSDLLALTPDDLTTLTNRGTVKRAQKELVAAKATFEIQDGDDGAVMVVWSDGITCEFPAGQTIHEAICSSGLAGITRHVVRSVLAYQSACHADQSTDESADESADESDGGRLTGEPTEQSAETFGSETPAAGNSQAVIGVWDPGTFSDEDLIARFRKAAVTKARKRFQQGVLVELTRGAKPTARFLDDACTVRFLVPGDLRYLTADCADSLLPTWVPLAVWAFRKLPAEQLTGIVSIQYFDSPPPTAAVAELWALLDELFLDGLESVTDAWTARITRLENNLRGEGLVWPADLIVDLLHQQEMYRQHDARFEPQQLVQLIGELIARLRAITASSTAVPQPLIRGSKSDRPSQIAGGRMVGVGLGVRVASRSATLNVYLQDVDSGNLVTVERTFTDPDPESGDLPRTFDDLANTIVARGVSLVGLASSQLLIKSGKRTPAGVLVLPRTAASLATNPQSFQWEQLRPPFSAESFAQLNARFTSLPPTYLRPRRRTENLHVVAVTSAEDVSFDIAHQRLTATLRDSSGGTARLLHPFHSRGQQGFSELLDVLEKRGKQLRFVCGHFRSSGRELIVYPISLILDDGQRRIAIQPWLASNADTTEAIPVADDLDVAEESSLQVFLTQLGELLTDMVLTGVRQADGPRWQQHADFASQIGFVRIAGLVTQFARTLSSRANTIAWDSTDAVRLAKQLCMLSRMAME